MNALGESEAAAWRRCEQAWGRWLEASRYAVVHLNEVQGNTPGSQAPLIAYGGRHMRAPDFQTTKNGNSEYWEVKFRTRSDYDHLTGSRDHWMSYDSFRDYLEISEQTGCRVWIILYEGPSSTTEGRWLRADVHDLLSSGREAERFGSDGGELRAWVWPTSTMQIVEGPRVELGEAKTGLLPTEGSDRIVTHQQFRPFERRLRHGLGRSAEKQAHSQPEAPVVPRALESDTAIGLDVLSASLGLPSVPRYSVLRIGLDGIDLDDLLGLLHYGIRVFLVSRRRPNTSFDPADLESFLDSRLLEWSEVDSLTVPLASAWVVDGVGYQDSQGVLTALHAADQAGGINSHQYEIIHAPSDSDVLVTAGAGTGKTETMSERTVFLLATVRGVTTDGLQGATIPYELQADDLVLMTFTREAARQMRERLSNTLALRQRLCRLCVLPALAWIMQLSRAEIVTIHTYAKRLLQAGGGRLGLSSKFSVQQQTLEFRKILHESLSKHLTELIAKYPGIPPSYQWEDHFEAIWRSLESNGIPISELSQEGTPGPLDWGYSGDVGLEADIVSTINTVLRQTAANFRALSQSNEKIRLADLVPFALILLTQSETPPVKAPRFLFVDEFQDTDATQMDLVLQIRAKLGSRLFLVGDAKQGIYRFRGAEGNAFGELHNRIKNQGLQEISAYTLNRNFRSGSRLLASLHPFFNQWGIAGLLTYADKERLRPNLIEEDVSEKICFSSVERDDFSVQAAKDVAEWWERRPEDSIGILCRQNWQAVTVRTQLQGLGVPCELLVGGEFFTSPAAREMCIFLHAVAHPSDDAGLLQLCETRWSAGLFRGRPPQGVFDEAWNTEISPVRSWRSRIGDLAENESFSRADLDLLRQRIISVGALLNHTPVMAWITECVRVFSPEASSFEYENDDSERLRYGRGLDHLVTLMDTNFGEGQISLIRVLSWLRLQIATNRDEDEPIVQMDKPARVTALTVHKAKGLEFDCVLLPNTWTPFGVSKSAASRVSVLRRGEQVPRLVWQWKIAKNKQLSNVASTDSSLWGIDDKETIREEARLLYVALTRARSHLRVYLPKKRKSRPAAGVSSWADLLSKGI